MYVYTVKMKDLGLGRSFGQTLHLGPQNGPSFYAGDKRQECDKSTVVSMKMSYFDGALAGVRFSGLLRAPSLSFQERPSVPEKHCFVA
jgi:hypothetical protein